MSRPPVRLYDTFTRSRQELRPIHDGVVQIYSCGPTVYRYVHVGNLRTFMLPDLLCRSLTYLGFPTHQVMNTTDNLLTGVRGDPDPRKKHPGDFTLWKAAGEHRQQLWPSPWGEGFPGWHIECSAMSLSLLGERFDVHTGGADNVFPHHEAEIAQSEAVTGHRVVGLWMHGGLLMLSGARMAKSAGNFFRITELEDQGFDPLAFRYLALQAKYRAPLNFSTERLAGADRALRQLRERVAAWSSQSAP